MRYGPVCSHGLRGVLGSCAKCDGPGQADERGRDRRVVAEGAVPAAELTHWELRRELARIADAPRAREQRALLRDQTVLCEAARRLRISGELVGQRP